jgi:DNA-binding LytR/AlgR family response regulator
MTMAQAEQALAGKAFVRIHRSMLVNRARIAGLDRRERPREVRLIDGSVVKVGEAYRANLG